MIPVRLAVRNFMPYRDDVPPLDFNGIHITSIWGDNGNGKSALIDAMTWALWGKARARSADDLIHMGETEMGVEFDFTVGQENYRIVRKHAKPKRQRSSGQTVLEFQVASNGGFRSISGDTLTQTQQRIVNVLHMDYDTFENSAYLRQGHADEFTKQQPAKRKEVLANIMGLTIYDELEEQAKELAKQQDAKKTLAEITIADINDELAGKSASQSKLEEAQQALSLLDKTSQAQEIKLNELRRQKELRKSKQSQLSQIEEHLDRSQADLTRWQEQIERYRQNIKSYQELINRRAEIEKSYSQFSDVKKQHDELDSKFRQSVNLERQQTQLEEKIKDAGQSLLTEHALVQNRVTELETSTKKLPQLKEALQEAQTELHQVTDEENRLLDKKEAHQELCNSALNLTSDNTRLAQDIKEIVDKLALLVNQTEAECPLCERELEKEGLQLITEKYTGEKQQKSESLESNQTELARKKQQADSLENEISRLEKKLDQGKTAGQNKSGLLNQQISEAEKGNDRLSETRQELVEIEEQLARKDFASGEQEALKQLDDEVIRLDYGAEKHESIRQQLTSLAKCEEPNRKLEEADRLLNQEQEALSRAEQASQELSDSLENNRQKKQELTTELTKLPNLDSDLTQAESEQQAQNTRQQQSREIVGSIKARLERYAELEIKKEAREKQLNLTTKESQVYQDLSEAFGKKGIQALLIEMAIPEIEVETNKLLGKMTDGRMNVKIETQRETRSGDTRETLDINISDELGTRDYEMFSGGETFRINFAIRIALSRLLARRKGAPLRTLIIDEGFGTQDSTGLEKLKEAITSIQDDFDKILIITHIEEFRDAFPARIDVTKNAEGSTFEIS